MSRFLVANNTETILKKLPRTPGVYMFRDGKRGVLYVGRATSLRSRVSSYFSGKDSRGERIFRMVALARSIETIETETVLESVILEANLIKKHLPKYNVDLKDGKSFSYFAVTREEFPRVLIVRETDVFFPPLQRGGGESSSRRGSGLDFKIQNSKFKISAEGTPSVGVPTSPPLQGEKYRKVYGPYTSKRHMETVLKILRKIFPFHSSSAKSEKGCLYRQIGLCPGPYDDGISKEAYRKNIRNIEYVLRGQKKRLLATLEREMKEESKKENFERATVLRGQVFALRHVRDIALLTRNTDRRMQNAGSDEIQNTERGTRISGKIQSGVPRFESRVPRIEAYDISNISGEHAVASMVVFENGEPKKSEYRKFKIQSVKGANDVAMMREVLARRVRHTEWKTPDMIVLDGGRGHLNMATALWKALNVHIPLVAIAKGPTRKKVELHIDPAFAPDPNFLEDTLLLEHLREEAHRFAIAYHRKTRRKNFLS